MSQSEKLKRDHDLDIKIVMEKETSEPKAKPSIVKIKKLVISSRVSSDSMIVEVGDKNEFSVRTD
jgi:hypothetical protein